MWAHVSHRSNELASKDFDTAFRYEIIEISDGNITKMRGKEFFEKLKIEHKSIRVFLVPSFYHDLYKGSLGPDEMVGYFFFKEQYFRISKTYFIKVGTNIVISLQDGVFDTEVAHELVDEFSAVNIFPDTTEWYLGCSIQRLTFLMEKTLKTWEDIYHLSAEETGHDPTEEIAKLDKIERLLNSAPAMLSVNLTIAGGLTEEESVERIKYLHRLIVSAKQRIYDDKLILFRRIHPRQPPTLFAGLVALMQTIMRLFTPVLTTLFQLRSISNITKFVILLMAIIVSNVWFTLFPQKFLTDAVTIIHEEIWHLWQLLRAWNLWQLIRTWHLWQLLRTRLGW
ncbi:uncharacterized protein NDAI_0B00580 [Naumovozyma dairenensis CBS 421]|uniref:Uncharacterized protein n=1 Tax=Naumovozyma dairenensis (strain ATCC 10597 / BCRC 20456 / CBS 421 / NBRC 0211 / NRRL Y-12639) TaxID=1071378 RepID=G0W5N0_NAUDC|nr:hypothetical protein NDAI_0B00580 [Naumovozyma dairenensis CBS 421]CCD23091.1 hypothetical protein NDAI_0B00580 [Naumovozyma dairenensis CBS 421]